MAQNDQARKSLPPDLRGVDIAQMRATTDGWSGITRAINTAGLSSNERKGFQDATLLSDSELTGAYRQNWIAQDAVQRAAIDIIRAWWDIQSEDAPDDAEAIEDWIADHDAKGLFKEALTWARLYGGAAIILGIDDGGSPEMPVNVEAIRDIRWARVVDRRYCHVMMRNRDADSWDFGNPLIYSVGMRYEGAQMVHASRVLAFVGEPLPDDYRDAVGGWGDSVLERSWDAISRYQTAARSLTIACERFIQSTFKVADLASWVANEDGPQKALQRLQTLNAGLYTGNIAMIDSAVESFDRQGLPMTGLTDTLRELRTDVAGALKRPESHIFGQQQGTTRTGAGADMETYFTSIRSMAEEDCKPQLETLIDYLAASRNGPIDGRGLDYTLRPGMLAQPDPKQTAETLEIEAKAGVLLINAGVAYPSEIRAGLMGESELFVPSDEITAMIEADETAEPPDDDDLTEQMTGTPAGTTVDAVTDAARPPDYVMAAGGNSCGGCMFRIVAAGAPWCNALNAMVSDAYTCDTFTPQR
jgi:uncharacterized protein